MYPGTYIEVNGIAYIGVTNLGNGWWIAVQEGQMALQLVKAD